jgi:cytochrome c nitrite reductase small subunit
MPTVVGALLAIMIGVLIGASGHTFLDAHGLSYMSNDPAACVNCHVMRDHFDAWQHSSHERVAGCNDCHVPHDFLGKYFAKAEHGYRHSKAFTLQNFHEPIRITDADLKIVQNNCVRCHEAMVDQMHISPKGERAECVHCHQTVGHSQMR